MIHLALEKNKRTNFNVIENKISLKYAAEAAWPVNGSILPTPKV